MKVVDIKTKITSMSVETSCVSHVGYGTSDGGFGTSSVGYGTSGVGYETYPCASDMNIKAGTNIKAALVKSIDNALLSARGFCLDCVKTGDRAERAGECRIPHSNTQRL